MRTSTEMDMRSCAEARANVAGKISAMLLADRAAQLTISERSAAQKYLTDDQQVIGVDEDMYGSLQSGLRDAVAPTS
jgi:hypothetical protein